MNGSSCHLKSCWGACHGKRDEYIIPLKARAWLDLTERKGNGEPVDEKSIRKHRNDVFRLYRILIPGDTPNLSGQVAKDMTSFITAMDDEDIGLKSLGYELGLSLERILKVLREVYGLKHTAENK